ncbi:MAG: NAD(P)-dependent oxidoreductase [Planctomycetes bacterium]|nr:NAD(P)-dependent oxidoreductase [Planctomycetota bacterium]
MSEQPPSAPRAVLVTGVPGNIGSYFVTNAPERYRLRMLVQHDDDQARALANRGEIVVGDLSDRGALADACRGMDTVLHLAANPDPSAAWDELIPANIAGTYNLFAAAQSAGCRRVIFASSIHAVIGHPHDHLIRTDDPVNPPNLYGVTKCFGEALGRYFAEQQGLSVLVVRIGAFQPPASLATDWGRSIADIFVSQRDLHQLLCRCIDDQGTGFAIAHGLSDNRTKRLDLADTRERFGYAPEDDAYRFIDRCPEG